MNRAISIFLILCLLGLSMAAPALAEEAQPEAQPEAAAAVPADDLSVTRHSAVIQGESIDYTATAGTMVVNSGGDDCEIFFVAYTRDGVEDPSTRPVTFAYNGGPGCASNMVHLLCMGPRRMELGEDGHASSLPAKLIDNNNSILDLTDLVFIDAPGTGYSRGVNGEDNFIGYYNDIRTFGDFIRLYVTRNHRWGSPLYVAGESYGTTRSAGLCDYLADQYNMGLTGVMLISSVNDFIVLLNTDDNEMPYVCDLPTMAADAWYHGRVSEEYREMELEDYLEEVRDFASGDYLEALFMGTRLSDEDKEGIAQKMSEYLGLDVKFILKHNLRLTMEDFCTTLLEDQKLMVGRYDGRYVGPLIDGDFEGSTNDPSTFDIAQPLTGLVNQYVCEELDYHTDRPYIPEDSEINEKWNFILPDGFISQESTIRDCMSANSHLKVWVLCGYFDGATPFFGAEWVFSHLFLNEDRVDNLQMTYYPSGHMFYLDTEAFDKFRKDAEAWYAK